MIDPVIPFGFTIIVFIILFVIVAFFTNKHAEELLAGHEPSNTDKPVQKSEISGIWSADELDFRSEEIATKMATLPGRHNVEPIDNSITFIVLYEALKDKWEREI